MSERHAKALRRAVRAYVTVNRPGLAVGPRAAEAAARIAVVVRRVWPRLNARWRGRVGALLRAGELQRAAQAACS